MSAERVQELQTELREAKGELEIVNRDIAKLWSKKSDLEERVTSIRADLKSLSKTQKSIEIYEGDEFPWTKEMYKLLNDVFKIQEFRELQKPAINATMSKVDCLLVMPTGSGKSLCFQLPALLSPGVTVVVSPLISLMEDQLLSLKNLEIESAVLNSQCDRETSSSIYNSMIDPKSPLKLLYITPEKLAKAKRLMSQLEKMYRMGRLSRLVIDEMHCVSEWGHEFRTDYKFLGIMKTQFPNTPLLGLTATATPKVIVDIQKVLGIEGSLLFKGSFYRENLQYEVYDSSEDKIEEIGALIRKRFPQGSGIIYCLTIKDVEEVTKGLKDMGFKAGSYHAQLEAEYRSFVQSKWYSNDLQIIVATVAFGMGINKLDVRFVIHYTLSKSIENYYQETGRAGRDGAPASCIAFFRFQDIFRATSLMFTERTGKANVYKMLGYCLNGETCRKELLAVHFGDKWEMGDCGNCDNCTTSPQKVVKTVQASGYFSDLVKILTKAEENNERLTPLKLLDSWFGKGNKKNRCEDVKSPKHSRETCQHIVARFMIDGYLKEDFHFTPYSTISYIVRGDRDPPTLLNYQIQLRQLDLKADKSVGKRKIQKEVETLNSSSPSGSSLKKVKSSDNEDLIINID